jgi:hypothetical protein
MNFLKRDDSHRRQTEEIREKLQRLHDDLQEKPEMKIKESMLFDINSIDTSPIFDPPTPERVLGDRLVQEGQSTLIDSRTRRTIFFVVDTRMLASLLGTIDQQVTPERRDL